MRGVSGCRWPLSALVLVIISTAEFYTCQAATIQYDQCVAMMSWPAAASALNLQECVKPLTTCNTCQGLRTDQMGNVLEVDLHLSLLNSTLPPAWTALSGLKSLNLSSTAVKGPLPSEWRKLTALTKLDVSNNTLDGTLPAEWRALTALVDLNLSFNKMHGGLPSAWSTLIRLTQLWLSRNSFTGPLPQEWSSFTSLQGIYLCGNKVLGGKLPASWSQLGSLNVMLAHSNSLSGPIPAEWASSLRNLSLIQLDRNQLTGPIPSNWFASKPRMTWFSIASNQLKGPIPTITNNPLLQVLDVQNNSLTGTIPYITTSIFPNISALRIGRNQFRGAFPQLPPSLIYLDARRNGFTGNITSLPATLKYLNVESNQLTSITTLYSPNITFISVGANQLSQRLPRPLSPSVQMINASYNNFSGPIPPSWADTACAVMDISNNRLEGPIAANLTAAVLIASYNRLSGTLPSVWPSNPPILVLDVQNNSIGGKLPTAWLQQDDMKYLKFLGVANNKFRGPIPVQWVEAGGANRTKLVLGDSMWAGMVQHKLSEWLSTANSKWLKAVCTNPELFKRLGNIQDNDAVNGLAAAVQQDIENVAVDAASSLDAVKTNNVQIIAIVGQMYMDWGSVPLNDYFMELGNRTDKLDRKEICSNGNKALPVVLVLWAFVIICVIGCFIMYAYLKPFMHSLSDARGFNFLPRQVLALHALAQSKRNQCMVRTVHIACIIVYWGDIITDVLVLIAVWGPNWPTFALFVILVSHNLLSAAVLSYRYAAHTGKSKCSSILFLPLTAICIPILDTFAFAHEADLPLGWLARLIGARINFTIFHESRALLETFLESVPSCIVLSVIFIMGNNPSRPLFVDGRIFLLSILFSGARTVVTAVTVLWQALFSARGLVAYCWELVLGHELFEALEAGSMHMSNNVQKGFAGRGRGPPEVLKPSTQPTRTVPAPLTVPLTNTHLARGQAPFSNLPLQHSRPSSTDASNLSVSHNQSSSTASNPPSRYSQPNSSDTTNLIPLSHSQFSSTTASQLPSRHRQTSALNAAPNLPSQAVIQTRPTAAANLPSMHTTQTPAINSSWDLQHRSVQDPSAAMTDLRSLPDSHTRYGAPQASNCTALSSSPRCGHSYRCDGYMSDGHTSTLSRHEDRDVMTPVAHVPHGGPMHSIPHSSRHNYVPSLPSSPDTLLARHVSMSESLQQGTGHSVSSYESSGLRDL